MIILTLYYPIHLLAFVALHDSLISFLMNVNEFIVMNKTYYLIGDINPSLTSEDDARVV